jgi:hypothetical protein
MAVGRAMRMTPNSETTSVPVGAEVSTNPRRRNEANVRPAMNSFRVNFSLSSIAPSKAVHVGLRNPSVVASLRERYWSDWYLNGTGTDEYRLWKLGGACTYIPVNPKNLKGIY